MLIRIDLAAFANALDRRRSDFQTLWKGLTYPPFKLDDTIPPAFEEFVPEQRDRLSSIEDSHVLVSTSPDSLSPAEDGRYGLAI